VARVAKRPVADQVVVITGASYGLGRAIARAAGSRGAKVVLAARNAEALDAAAAEVEELGGQGLAVVADVASEADNQTIVDRAVDYFGRIDTYVACATVTVYAEVPRLEHEELRRVFDVNFFGRVYGFHAVLPHLRESRGTFVDVNSALAYRGIPLQAAYCATKASLRTFLESARVELQKEGSGVDVSVVMPGAINTPQFDVSRQKVGKQPQPVPPIYEPEPFAEAILHCFERPIRELPVGWGAQKLLWGQKLAPRAGDLVLRRSGWEDQNTGEPKPVGSPDNLFQTLPGDRGARGRFSDRARGSTAWTQLRLRPALATVLALLGLGAPAAAAATVASRDRKPAGGLRRRIPIG
jgi:NAD(P)-dependent dehydrogenase (short-subunit alcohol dehydrogenase family)